MKTLLLVRHAKSSWDDPSQPDESRPLAKRGEREAPKMGKRLAVRGMKPELIVTSPAVRARATAELLAQQLDYPPDRIIAEDRLYGSSAGEMLAVIRALDGGLKRVMLIGHNPMLDELVDQLTGGRVTHVPTCGAARLTYDVTTWTSIGNVEPTRARLYKPKKTG